MIPFAVVVPWVREEQRDKFLAEWHVSTVPDWLILQRDEHREGCGVTKNRGVLRAVESGADVVVVLDDDCFPAFPKGPTTLRELATLHVEALKPQKVQLFDEVTVPPSRGTPYSELAVTLPVAASMGFWLEIGDHCAVRQLATRAAPMTFLPSPRYWRWFPLCGMNLAFRPKDWLPWCSFIDVPRFDDIWMGWLWQKEAYRRGYCFNLNGPLIRHGRQSNVWTNLREEAVHLEATETLWRTIAMSQESGYEELMKLLPHTRRS